MRHAISTPAKILVGDAIVETTAHVRYLLDDHAATPVCIVGVDIIIDNARQPALWLADALLADKATVARMVEQARAAA